jgi:hypothetical protein
MGKPINPNVKVTISDDVAKYANIRIDPTVDSFVFCVSRSPADELCMAYAIVASSEETAREFLHSNKYLHNVLKDYQLSKAQQEENFEEFSAEAVRAGGIPPPVMRSCCKHNRNVPVYVVEEDDASGLKTTVLFNKFIQATFPDHDPQGNPIPDPLKRGLTSMVIREVSNPNSPDPDTKCQPQ